MAGAVLNYSFTIHYSFAAWEDGQRYEEIRDTLREPWNRQMREEGARQGEHGEER